MVSESVFLNMFSKFEIFISLYSCDEYLNFHPFSVTVFGSNCSLVKEKIVVNVSLFGLYNGSVSEINNIENVILRFLDDQTLHALLLHYLSKFLCI